MDKRGERLRESMHKAIEKYGVSSIQVLKVSQKLDLYVNRSMKGERV